jgi:hypothetical protein
MCKYVVKHNRTLLVVLISLLPPVSSAAEPTVAPAYVVDHSRSPQARLRPLPLDAVEWTTGFWADRYRQLCEVTLAESWKLLADPAQGHVLDNFRFAAQPGSGQYAGTTWQDEWLYKWIEAAACVWRLQRDPALARRMDEAIALIAAAQQPDGYLSTMPLASQKPRFQSAQDHEIYNMGHLLTAGVIHHRMIRTFASSLTRRPGTSASSPSPSTRLACTRTSTARPCRCRRRLSFRPRASSWTNSRSDCCCRREALTPSSATRSTAANRYPRP